MKYVAVNLYQPSGGYVLVADEADGADIKYSAIRQGIVQGEIVDGLANTDAFQLCGHSANGSQSVIGEYEVPWQHDFSMTSVYDNA